MIRVDGSKRSGSGTIVRYSVSLSALLGEELHLTNIRAKRDKPGLRPQHLKAIEACAEISGGEVVGGKVGSSEIKFKPGPGIKGGDYKWDIGTAGSTTMLLMTILPIAIFSENSSSFVIKGGLFQDFAPSAFHMKYVLFPTLRKMGIEADLEIIRPGYVPRGEGIIRAYVKPVRGKIKPLRLCEQGDIERIWGISLSSHLEERKVSHRMAREARRVLERYGFSAEIELLYDKEALQEGASLFLSAETSTGCVIGSDMAGRPGRPSEEIGRKVAQNLIEDIEEGATVDRFLMDQIVLYCALADGESVYRIPFITEHLETNLWLVEEILGAKWNIDGKEVRIEGVGR